MWKYEMDEFLAKSERDWVQERRIDGDSGGSTENDPIQPDKVDQKKNDQDEAEVKNHGAGRKDTEMCDINVSVYLVKYCWDKTSLTLTTFV